MIENLYSDMKSLMQTKRYRINYLYKILGDKYEEVSKEEFLKHFQKIKEDMGLYSNPIYNIRCTYCKKVVSEKKAYGQICERCSFVNKRIGMGLGKNKEDEYLGEMYEE